MRDKVKFSPKSAPISASPAIKGSAKHGSNRRLTTLRRLNTDYIDLYFSHWPDPQTPVAETLEAFHSLQQAGKIRAMGL